MALYVNKRKDTERRIVKMADKKQKEEKTELENKVVNFLLKHELSLVTAESCTGGLLTGRLVNVAGVSETLKAGLVTYSNKAKRKLLDVNKGTLKKYGAVSKQTAKEMVKGAALGYDAEVAVAITGVAGPDGGTEEKPVGLVYIACYAKEKVLVKEYNFKGNRQEIREEAVEKALKLMYEWMQENY